MVLRRSKILHVLWLQICAVAADYGIGKHKQSNFFELFQLIMHLRGGRSD